MLNVHIAPNWTGKPDTGQGGIRRVVEAQIKHLPKFGVQVIPDPDSAAVIANHGAAHVERPGVPMVNHNHGAMWSRYNWAKWAHDANKQVVESMVRAKAHTAPSEWVATALRRGMLIDPEVIYHGVDIEDWPVGENQGYVLWNKARHDLVSDSTDLFKIAQMMRETPFVCTVGKPTPNVRTIGERIPYEKMQEFVRSAGVYLATARETFGIGTLEALASGVPVAGWDWGGQREIIIPGETGYLAPPGNFEALQECIQRCFQERERLSESARQDVVERWGWEPRIKQYAELYKKVNRYYAQQRPRVSVVLTAHNLERFLIDALQSVERQTMEDFECLIIDDHSTDNTEEISKEWCKTRPKFKYLKTPQNMGLSLARNYGFSESRGLYIRWLDADDMMDEHALELESGLLDRESDISITYGHLQLHSEDGSPVLGDDKKPRRNPFPPPNYSWRAQMAHLNSIPSSCMLRREVMEKTGGYRKRHWRAEDAAFTCLATSFGIRAKKATERPTILYRLRSDSKSQVEWQNHGGDGDWTAWFPWRMGASDGKTGQNIFHHLGRRVPDPSIVPFGAQGEPPPEMDFWHVHDFAYPRVSVIIPVGPGHESLVIDAIESVRAQTYPDWEIIVVNDTGRTWKEGFESPVAGAPYVKVISTEGNHGVATARNIGAAHAKSSLLVWLDADDYWLPDFLERVIGMYEQNEGIIYTYWLHSEGHGKPLFPYKYKEFRCGHALQMMDYAGSSILVPRWIHEKVAEGQGGWDTEIPGMEDWDYQIAAQAYANACSYLVPETLVVYRLHAGINRERHYEKIDDIIRYLKNKWNSYYSGESKMGCGCAAKKTANSPSNSRLSSSGNFVTKQSTASAESSSKDMVLLEYNGEYNEPISIKGRKTGTRYKFGRMSSHRQKYVFVQDAEELVTRLRSDGKPEFVAVAKQVKPVEYEQLREPEFPAIGI